MPAAWSSSGAQATCSRRRHTPTHAASSPRCRGSEHGRRRARLDCRRSPASCPRSPRFLPAVASIRAATRRPTSARSSIPPPQPSKAVALCAVTTMADLLQVRDLAVHFQLGSGLFRLGHARTLRAVEGVDLTVKAGQCLGLVGESGCGKSTLGLAILGLQAPTRGRIILDGMEVNADTDRSRFAKTAQMVFQDPYASLNPRQTVRGTLATPLRLNGTTNAGEINDRVADMLARVGLRPEHANRYPHEFSGGQRQRIGIARALILRPKLVICDEPVSALDMSIRAQIINLLLELKESLGLAYIMISHDLSVVEHMSDHVAVMYLGRIVETGPWRDIFERPRHPYTRALIAAIPDPFAPADRRFRRVNGEIPSPLDPPKGCAFHPRCPITIDKCRSAPGPALSESGGAHHVSCWRAGDACDQVWPLGGSRTLSSDDRLLGPTSRKPSD